MIILFAVLLTGCPVEHDAEYFAEIRSDTHWKAIIQGKTTEGYGDQFLPIPKNPATNEYELPVCVEVQKLSIPGYLKTRVSVDGVSLLGSNDGGWAYTTADSGVVIACSDGENE